MSLPGLYIHIPFCVSKCAYCDFASFSGMADFKDAYLKALSLEAASYKKSFNPKTLYIGGGTPSVLSAAQLSFLCAIAEENFGAVKNFKEASFECNPESLTEEKAVLLKAAGFNRLSIGMQAMTDKHLKLIGRAHDGKQFLQAYKTARKYFDNISVDIIAGLPQQSLDDFKETLKKTVVLGPEHISVYGLQVEEGTPLYKSGFAADDALCRAMLEHCAEYLAGNGYGQYEISNFAKKGFESLHNTNYWRCGEYLGLGSSAASYIKGVRRANTEDLKEYIKALSGGQKPPFESERLTGKPKLGERIILGLRLTKGIELSPQMQKSFSNEIKSLLERGLIVKYKNNICLSNEGKYMANEVWRHFVAPF